MFSLANKKKKLALIHISTRELKSHIDPTSFQNSPNPQFEFSGGERNENRHHMWTREKACMKDHVQRQPERFTSSSTRKACFSRVFHHSFHAMFSFLRCCFLWLATITESNLARVPQKNKVAANTRGDFVLRQRILKHIKWDTCKCQNGSSACENCTRRGLLLVT